MVVIVAVEITNLTRNCRPSTAGKGIGAGSVAAARNRLIRLERRVQPLDLDRLMFTAHHYSLFGTVFQNKYCNRERNKQDNKQETTNSRAESMGPWCCSPGVHRGNRLWTAVAMCCSPFYSIRCWRTGFQQENEAGSVTGRVQRRERSDEQLATYANG